MKFFHYLNVVQFHLKLSYPIEKLLLLPAGFELWTLLLVSDADTLTNWAIAHSKIQVHPPDVMIVRQPEPSDQQFIYW